MTPKPKSTKRTTKKAAAPARKSAGKKSKEIPADAPVQQDTNGSAKNILVVDDDPALSRVMALKFQNAGCNVAVAHNGEMALKTMRQQKFDGIILDLIMPGKTGFDVLQDKKTTLNKDTPTFVMSDMRTQETIDLVMKLGATDFFVKMQMPLKEVIDSITSRT